MHIHWLLGITGVGFLIGSVPHCSNGLECYECVHVISKPSVAALFPSIPNNPDCINPIPGKVSKKTCDGTVMSCGKGGAFGDHLGFHIDVLVRGCIVPPVNKTRMNGCTDATGTVYPSNQSVVIDPDIVVQWLWGEPLDGFFKAAQAQGRIDLNAHMTGKFCFCNTKDFCNDAPGMKVVDTSKPNTTPSAGLRPIISAIPQFIFYLWISATSGFIEINEIMMK